MGRLARTPAEAYDPRQRAVADMVVQGARGKLAGPLLALIEHPSLCSAVQEVGRMLRFDGVLEPRLRELTILIVAQFWSADYEWRAHAPLALAAGLDAAVVEAIRIDADLPDDGDVSLVRRFCRMTLQRQAVDDGLVKALIRRLGTPGVLELAALVGYYSLIAHVLAIDGDTAADGRRHLPPPQHRGDAT